MFFFLFTVSKNCEYITKMRGRKACVTGPPFPKVLTTIDQTQMADNCDTKGQKLQEN